MDDQNSMDAITNLFAGIRSKGVRLWAENGRLRYQAPKGVLTQDDFERLRLHGSQIVALLEGAATAHTLEPRLESRPRLECAPLAFSQLAHWNLYRLSERRSQCHVVSATHLRGRLNIPVLQQCISDVVRRHDALRTQIVVLDGVPAQAIAASCDCYLDVEDLTTLSESRREAEVQRWIEKYSSEPIDVAVDRLFSVRLLRFYEEEHVLLVAMEHMISDGRSMSILSRELFTAYAQAVQGLPSSLPTISVQYPDYAAWQRHSQFPAIEKRIAYWHARMASCPSPGFLEDKGLGLDSRQGLGGVRFEIDHDLKAELHEWCRTRHTTLVMSACTAYVALVLRWCNVTDAVIRFQTDGRFSSKTENTIGYFAFPLYMRIQLVEDDSFVDLLKRVTQEYCRALEHADFSYLEAQVPKPQFTRSARFNWLAQTHESDYLDSDGSPYAITCSRVHPKQRGRDDITKDDDPTMGLLETDDVIRGSISFPFHRFSGESMERFARNFLATIRALLARPDARVRDIALVG